MPDNFRHKHTQSVGLLVRLLGLLGHLLGMGLSGLNADLPAGKLGGKTSVLAFLADGQRQLVIVDEGDGGLVLLADDLMAIIDTAPETSSGTSRSNRQRTSSGWERETMISGPFRPRPTFTT